MLDMHAVLDSYLLTGVLDIILMSSVVEITQPIQGSCSI